MNVRSFALATLLTAATLPAFGQTCQNDPSQFPAWLDGVRAEARAAGVSAGAVAALDGIRFDQSIVNRDRAQGVFAQTFVEFSDRMVNSYRLENGARLIRDNAALFAQIERQFGVPAPVIVAFWALETDFGTNNGDFPVLSSIATLAFDCRRPTEFRPHLIDALRLVDRGDLTPAEMVGAWAGEIGQTQFQPSDYLAAGVDYDGDGKVNLIRSVPDVLASTANLLRQHGWRAGEPWLEEVRVPAAMPWDRADVSIQHPVSDWAGFGVTRRDGSALPRSNAPASLVLPMGRNGPAFLAYANFQVYLDWNRSLVYSTTAAYLATRLAGAPRVDPRGPVASLTIDQARQLQTILAAQGFDVGRIDGIIGLQTRDAVRTVQIQYGLPADGYPTTELLARLTGGAVATTLTTEEARELQTLLIRQGFDIGAVDGVIGARTRAAVTEMQRRFGLPADGVATAEFLARLRAL
ncbi:MAG: lytic murein transglycosylase [Bauldia sp.]|nr:lytic murein transglycosylase [Bauldia sp.]